MTQQLEDTVKERPIWQRPRFIQWPGNFVLLYQVEPVQPPLLHEKQILASYKKNEHHTVYQNYYTLDLQ